MRHTGFLQGGLNQQGFGNLCTQRCFNPAKRCIFHCHFLSVQIPNFSRNGVTLDVSQFIHRQSFNKLCTPCFDPRNAHIPPERRNFRGWPFLSEFTDFPQDLSHFRCSNDEKFVTNSATQISMDLAVRMDKSRILKKRTVHILAETTNAGSFQSFSTVSLVAPDSACETRNQGRAEESAEGVLSSEKEEGQSRHDGEEKIQPGGLIHLFSVRCFDFSAFLAVFDSVAVSFTPCLSCLSSLPFILSLQLFLSLRFFRHSMDARASCRAHTAHNF